MPGRMDRATGIWVLAVTAVTFAVVVLVVRPRAPRGVSDALVALCGAALGAGGLWVQQGVGAAVWIVTVPVTAVLAVVHVRALFAGSGPLRI